jgi:hypothetical protein
MGAFGMGAFVFGMLTHAIANPDNLKKDDDGFMPPEVGEKVPSMIYWCLMIWGA